VKSQSQLTFTIARLAAEFLDDCDVSPSTLKNYHSQLRRFVARYGSVPLADASSELIGDYIASLNRLSRASHHAHRRTLSSLFRYGVNRGLSDSNPVTAIPPRKPDASKGEHYETEVVRYLSDEQIALLLQALSTSPNLRLQLILTLIYRSGARIREILNLDREQIDLKERSFTVIGKGNKRRLCYYAHPDADARDRAVSLLDEYLTYYHDGKHPALLLAEHRTTKRITRLSYAQAYKDLQALVAPIPQLQAIGFHRLRHTFATARVGTMALEELQALLGHANIATTQRYAKVTPKRAASVARRAINETSQF